MDVKDIEDIHGCFDHIARKQQLLSVKCEEVIDSVVNEMNLAINKIQSLNDPNGNDFKSILVELKYKLNAIDLQKMLKPPKDNVKRTLIVCQKCLEGLFYPDISKAHRNIDFDEHTVNKTILSHLYRHGQFELAECFVNESGVPVDIALKQGFENMHDIVDSLNIRNNGRALYWIYRGHHFADPDYEYLTLKLHQMRYFELLRDSPANVAADYLIAQIPNFYPRYNDVLDEYPYAELADPRNWDKLAEEITGRYCNDLGLYYESSLSVLFVATLEVLPSVLKHLETDGGAKQVASPSRRAEPNAHSHA
ncbi:hypothetical protein RJ641_013428 [Dillenia turbinata]|uniref:CTLH/CRA C-terminal to LisH motif domain-containing protein n=1 Tax=Dillenia turbinata TaxID=194707 RepID=A0AAN8ZLF0_9MAGN